MRPNNPLTTMWRLITAPLRDREHVKGQPLPRKVRERRNDRRSRP